MINVCVDFGLIGTWNCFRQLHLGRRFLCPHCGHRAKSNANLRSHIAQRHGDDERKVECRYCLKKLSSKSNLKAHVS